MNRNALLCSFLIVFLTACTQFPELEHTQAGAVADAEYPTLVPLEPLLARASAPGPDPVQTQAALSSRLAGLRARANAIRGSVLTGAEKQRLQQGLR